MRLTRWAPWAGWLPFAAISIHYLLYLGGCWWAAQRLHRDGRWAAVRREPAFVAALALAAWLALTALWSPAGAWVSFSHVWHYALPIALPALAHALAPETARAMLRQFVLAAGAAGLLLVAWRLLAAGQWVPAWGPAGWPVIGVGPTGNGMIVLSLLLALGCALACWLALGAYAPRQRLLHAALAAAALAGLLAQDRRSGLVLLPLLCTIALLGLRGRPRGTRRLAIAALGLGMLGAAIGVATTERLSQRFGDVAAELRAYTPAGDVQTSVGMRLRMAQVSLGMLRERPLTGHGVGSWETLWPGRADGGALLRAHNTPHNEYLLVAAQGGLPALLLLLLWFAAGLRSAWRLGPGGVPLLLVWTSLAGSALFNATLRDARLALPLLLLAAVAWAAARTPPR